MQKKVPSSTGYSLAWDNVGKTENKGVELVINTQNFNQRISRGIQIILLL